MAKNFKTVNPLEEMITRDQVEEEEKVKIVYLKEETKTKRLNLLLKPSTYTKIKKIAKRNDISINELFNQLAEERIKKED